MTYISEFLLYCCFALLVGNQLLMFIPDNKRPNINVPNWIVNLSIVGIAILSLFPLITIVNMFAEDFEEGYWIIFKAVLLEFNIGHAWLITLFLAALLLFIRSIKRFTNEPKLEYISAAFTFALILAFGWASHCTASYQLKGFIPHSIHFLAVSVWIGTLLTISWFSTNNQNWLAFLRWFSPLALICLTATISSGFFLMTLLVPDYVNSWMVSYGQALLFKHLLIIPLVTFAFINGVMVKRKLVLTPSFNPIPMARAESIIALLVFGVMAIMGQQSPTDNLAAVIEFDKPSKLFQLFYEGKITQTTTIEFVSNGNSIMLAIIAVLCLGSTVFFFRTKTYSSLIAIVFSILFVGTAYTALMLGVSN
ncbi:copper resistance protein CopD [Acinetobacter sp. CUI P1]|nr:copper resistance protein CopD [Acinetobacter sp. CUI P1]